MTEIGRRQLIRGAGSAALLGAVGAGALAGCTDGGDNKRNSTEVNAGVELPKYIPFTKVSPDLASTEQGILAGFLTYPASPVQGSTTKPGSGGSITALAQIDGAPPPPLAKNRYWQELNTRLGVELKLEMAPGANYSQRLATTIAGGDLPDLVQIQRSIPQLPKVMESQFQDLTEFLSGDKIAKYPFLAALPTSSWRPTVVNGGIYGIPFPLGLAGTAMLMRRDLFEAKGLTDPITSAESFLAACGELTEPNKNRWALCFPDRVFQFAQEMTGAPNIWQETDGKFRHMYEFEETKEALSFTAKLWKNGYFHPDSLNQSTGTSKQWFGSGTVAMYNDGYSSWRGYMRTYGATNSSFTLGLLPPPPYGGTGTGHKFFSPGIFTFTAMKKADSATIEKLLKILDWIAAPFGTEEYLFRKFGIEGHNYKKEGSDPLPLPAGANEVLLPTSYLANPAPILYEPGYPDQTRSQHEYQKAIIPNGYFNPSNGLFSETNSDRAAMLEKNVADIRLDIIAGRKPISEWDAAVKNWLSSGGEQIRQEYEKEFAATND